MIRKRLGWLLAAAAVLLLLAGTAAADEAENLTESCTVKVSSAAHGSAKSFTDGSYESYWESKKTHSVSVTLTSPSPLYGLYLCFERMPDAYLVQTGSGDHWTTLYEGDTRYHHTYYPLNGETGIRILADAEKGKTVYMGFNELFVFGPGETPAWVQRWEPQPEKTDLLFVATHPDDELLFMGGAIATYAMELKKQVAVAYLSYSNTTRRSEALNGLWTLGIRNYPVFLNVSDQWSDTIQDAYKKIKGGKTELYRLIIELIRRLKPDVIVSHDLKGEYGHTQHKMVAKAVQECFSQAADPEKDPASAASFGTWQAQKLYLHLYGDESNQVHLDLDVPLDSLGGKTATEAAEAAYAMHMTQRGKGQKIRGVWHEFSVREYGSLYPSNIFGLAASMVGDDTRHNDFLENLPGGAEVPSAEVPADVTPAVSEDIPAEAPAETSAETPAEAAPQEPPAAEVLPVPEGAAPAAPEWAQVVLNARGFLDEGEYVLDDEENGHYMYVSPTLRVQVIRSLYAPETDKRHPCHIFTAHVWCDIAGGELPHTVWSDPENPRTNAKKISVIGREQQIVLASSTDYYTYRVGRKKEDRSVHVGIEVRNGEILYDDPEPKKDRSMPNFDALALMRDGTGQSFPSKSKSAAEYIAEGALEVFTFGPCLVKDGEFTPYLKTANTAYNPRLAFGVAEPGHYVLMLCEGRLARSKGVQMTTLAALMKDEGCTLAVNMDGGQTAVLAFMGRQLNLVPDIPEGRPSVEALAFGTSPLVGQTAGK